LKKPTAEKASTLEKKLTLKEFITEEFPKDFEREKQLKTNNAHC